MGAGISDWRLARAVSSQGQLGVVSGTALDAILTRRLQTGDAGGHMRRALDRFPSRPIADRIWNLSRSMAELRRAIGEASRIAAPGAGLFVFTFSRSTLPPDASCVPGEPFIYTQFSGQPQCFLTREQLTDELALAGFVPDGAVAFAEHNLPPANAVHAVRAPVILEAGFRRVAR